MAAIAAKRRLRVPKLDLSGFFALVVEAGKAWSAHRVPRMGAALSYYTAFSLAPMVIFILSLATLVVKEKDASYYIVQEVTDLIGPNGGAAVQDILDHATSTHALSWGTAISFVVLLIGASGAFGELQDSLNSIWEVPPQKNAFLTMIKERALSFAMVFVLGFFMLVSLTLSALISAVSRLVVYRFPSAGLELTNTLISFVAFFGLFCIIFRLLPDVPLKWSDVWPGAIFSSALFIVGKFLLGWYIGFSSTTFSRYGAAGSFIVILVWVFYSAQILFMGAEFSRAYTLKYGSHRKLTKQGEPVMGDEVAPSS
jgi:membrane protein